MIVMKSIVRFVASKVKDKKKQNIITPQSSNKNIEKAKQNPPKLKPTKRRQIAEKVTEKKSPKRKLVQISEYKTNDEPCAMDIVIYFKRKI